MKNSNVIYIQETQQISNQINSKVCFPNHKLSKITVKISATRKTTYHTVVANFS